MSQSALADSGWLARLPRALEERRGTVLRVGGETLTGPAIAAATAAWGRAFRGAGLAAGDRVALVSDAGAAFVPALLAASAAQLTVAPVPRGRLGAELYRELDLRAVVAGAPGDAGSFVASPDGGPLRAPAQLRTAELPRDPDARLLLRTSATAGAARTLALSERNVTSVLASHVPHLDLPAGTALSVLPWHHVFGLVLDLLMALAGGATLVRDPGGGRDAAALLALGESSRATHLCAVPLIVERLRARPRGQAFLAALRGGIVGGAPVGGPLAEALSATRLRVGYGQTEASPGLTLGAPGRFGGGYVGRPVGCELRVDATGVLEFRGPNACLGTWGEGGVRRLPADRWASTGDYAREQDGDWFFLGRADATFKLANGRLVEAGRVEAGIRRALPGLGDLLLWSADGVALDLGVTLPGGGLPDEAAVRPLLGPLAALPLRLHAVAPDAWRRTPKGDPDRLAPPDVS